LQEVKHIMPSNQANSNAERVILVTGATGQQGGAVARSLLERGFAVRGLTRDPSKKTTGVDHRIQWVKGDLNDGKSLDAALHGAHGFYLVTTPFTGGWGATPDVEGEVRSGTAALEAAKRAKTPHVVLSTITGAGSQTQPTGIPHFDSKIKLEQQARSLGTPITFVRPSFFMENLFQPLALQSYRTGIVSMPIKPGSKIPMVAVRDIGEIAARAFEEPERRIGKGVDLQGDTKTYPEVVDSIARRLGVQARYAEMSDQDGLKYFGEDMLRMFRGFDYGGFGIDVAGLEREWGIKMTRFEDLLKDTKLALPDPSPPWKP
jgi:uncharacterized protein YbjT (DUF2867 family)